MLSYCRVGKGRPVVFLHGFLEDSTMWEGLDIDGIDSIRIDLPGHGKSASIFCESIPIMAEMVHEVMESLCFKSYDVVGHSMGGYIGMELLSSGQCERLVLLNSNFWADNPQKKADRMRVAKLVHHKKDHFIFEAIPNLFYDPDSYDGVIRSLITRARKMSPEAIAASSIGMMNRNDHTETYKNNEDHILIIQGKNDEVVRMDQMLEKLNAKPIHFCLLNAAHMAVFEAKEETLKCIENFLIKNGN